MVGLNKFTEKERRRARRSFQSDRYKEDLRTPKYREKTIQRKRKEDEYDDEEDSSLWWS